MRKAVVILGAGSSAPFGVPTLRYLFKDSSARKYLKEDATLSTILTNIFWAPRGIDLETSHESLSVEEILTLTRDQEKNSYEIPGLSEPQLQQFRKSLYVLIKKAIYDNKSTSGRHLNSLISHMGTNYDEVTWATFNWDCLFESSFYYSSGTDWSNRRNPQVGIPLYGWGSSDPKHKFLKLHGGINWWYENNRISYLRFGGSPELNDKWAAYQEGTAVGRPVILEPSYYKYEDPMYVLIKPQWEIFLDSLKSANTIMVIGYSLPESDSNARSIMTIAFQNNLSAKWIVIDGGKDICVRYKRLFGLKRLCVFQESFEEFNADFERKITFGLAS